MPEIEFHRRKKAELMYRYYIKKWSLFRDLPLKDTTEALLIGHYMKIRGFFFRIYF